MEIFMKLVPPMMAALFACAAAFARPVVVQTQQVLPTYSDYYGFAGRELIGTSWETLGGSPERFRTTATLLERGVDGTWTRVRDLAIEDGFVYTGHVAMTSSVAAIVMPRGLRVWERTAAGWVEAAVDPAARVWGADVEVSGGTILVSLMNDDACPRRVAVVTRAASGVWSTSAHFDAPAGACIHEFDVDQDRAIVHADHQANDAQDSATIYERSGTGWVAAATLQAMEANRAFGPAVALRGSLAIVSGTVVGAHLYRRDATGWQAAGFLPNSDSYSEGQFDSAISISDQYVAKVSYNRTQNTGIVYLYRRGPGDTFEHVANLVTGRGNGYNDVIVDGSYVIAKYQPELHAYDFSAFVPPPTVQDDFESGTTEQWAPIPGSSFSNIVAGNTRIYRQSSVAGDAGAIHELDLEGQHISADIRPTGFDGNDRWVGLVTRYTDAANYYYLTLRNSNRLVLRRMRNGVFTDLAQMPIGPSSSWQRVGLESVGSRHTVYLDNRRVADAFDESHPRGRTGLRMYRAAADFDNVIVSPGPLIDLAHDQRITTGGTWSQDWNAGLDFFSQQSTSGEARALSGVPTVNAVVQAYVQVERFATGGAAWVGLVTRYVDAGNYYYVTLRNSNELSLRKLTNGSISVLASETLAVTPQGPELDIRLEAIGNRVRVYVNEQLRLEADAEQHAGKVGVMTYRAAAHFLRHLPVEP
jgi:hypothetical protein